MKKYFFSLATLALFAIGFAASDESYDDDFSSLESYMPENGSSIFVVYDTKPFGDRNRRLQAITFFEKDDNCDVRIDGIETNGSSFKMEGFWNKGTKKSTYQAVEYRYLRLGGGDNNTFFIDKDLNIYYCNAYFEGDEDVATAFKNGAIGKLRKCANEENAKQELEKINQEAKKTDKKKDNISLLEGEEREMADAGYKNGQLYGMAGSANDALAGVHIISENVDELGDKFNELVEKMAGDEYDKAYDVPTNTNQENLKKIYIKYFVKGFTETMKSMEPAY